MDSRRIAGKRAKNNGAMFERQFEQICEIQGVGFIRIPDSCRQVGAHRLIRTVSPFDAIICYRKRAAFIDLKTILGVNFTHSMIVPHQLNYLLEASQGGVSGYVIRMQGSVWFASSLILFNLKPRESLKPDSGLLYLGTENNYDVRLIFADVKS